MKKQSVGRLKQLMEKFPVIADLEEVATSLYAEVKNTVSIRVQRADPGLMYLQASNADGESKYCIREDSSKGSRLEVACAVDVTGKVVVRKTWDRLCQGYVKDIFQKVSSDSIQYILWLSTSIWHKPTSEIQERNGVYLGKMTEVERTYTVFPAPKDGNFTKLLAITDIKKNVWLSTRMLLNGLLNHDTELDLVNKMLYDCVDQFEKGVYLNGLKELIEKSDSRGMSGTFNGVSLMTYVMCGRVMITLEKPSSKYPNSNDSFTIIGVEPPDKPQFGWQSVYATMDQAKDMVKRVVDGWSELTPDQAKSIFKDSDSVTLDVLAAAKAKK